MSKPSDDLFTIVRVEPDLDMFIAYLSGRLADWDEDLAQSIVDYYREWLRGV